MITKDQAIKLGQNPYYKPTPQQKAVIDKHAPQVNVPEYGVLPKHDTSFEKHPTEPIKKKRSSKKRK